MTDRVDVGDKAPPFSLPTDGDGTISLEDFSGHKAVVYFYPKDDTPGCTIQAIAFSEHLEAFLAAGTVIVGISADTPAKHDKFVAKHGLKITLGSDPELETLKAYGVWVEKNMYGRKYMGIERTTFLIDENGVIARVWRKVRVKGHVEEVLEATMEL